MRYIWGTIIVFKIKEYAGKVDEIKLLFKRESMKPPPKPVADKNLFLKWRC
jgi:hypothetical protein